MLKNKLGTWQVDLASSLSTQCTEVKQNKCSIQNIDSLGRAWQNVLQKPAKFIFIFSALIYQLTLRKSPKHKAHCYFINTAVYLFTNLTGWVNFCHKYMTKVIANSAWNYKLSFSTLFTPKRLSPDSYFLQYMPKIILSNWSLWVHRKT